MRMLQMTELLALQYGFKAEIGKTASASSFPYCRTGKSDRNIAVPANTVVSFPPPSAKSNRKRPLNYSQIFLNCIPCC